MEDKIGEMMLKFLLNDVKYFLIKYFNLLKVKLMHTMIMWVHSRYAKLAQHLKIKIKLSSIISTAEQKYAYLYKLTQKRLGWK